MAWGYNGFGQTNTAAGLTNALAIAAGFYFSEDLQNNGAVVAWSDNTHGQTNPVANMPQIKSLAAGWYHGLAGLFSPYTQYPIDVAQDLLLICNSNTNSQNSLPVLDYYLANRPMVSGANMLAVNCATNETFFCTTNGNFSAFGTNTSNYVLTNDFTNFLAQVQHRLAANPTKRPQYVILFPYLPSRISWDPYPGHYDGNGASNIMPSAQYQLAGGSVPGWFPFLSSLSMNGLGGTNDCLAYINKPASFGSNYAPGRLIISASAGGYGNTNYYFDDSVNNGAYTGDTPGGTAYTNVITAGAAAAAVDDELEPAPDTNLAAQITGGTNLAGYFSWGFHRDLGFYHMVTNSHVTNNITDTNGLGWSGQSSWWIIDANESFNGQRAWFDYDYAGATNLTAQFLLWFSPEGFGGTNYANTPVGSVSHVDEPGVAGNNTQHNYFGLWQAGRNFGQCAWLSIGPERELQVVGDPFVKR